MNRDRVIKMARDAGFICDEADFIFPGKSGRIGIQLELERFAQAIRNESLDEAAAIFENGFDDMPNIAGEIRNLKEQQ